VDVSAWERLRRVDPRIWDGLLALGSLVAGVIAFESRIVRPNDPPVAYGIAIVVVSSVAIAWRRRMPYIVAAVVCGAASIGALFGWWPEVVFLVWIALYSAAAYGARERLVRVLFPVALVTSVAI